MKILLDTQIFNNQKFGGISRYHTEVFLALEKIGINIECTIVYSDNWHLKESSLFQNYRNVLFNPRIWPKFINKKISKLYKRKNLHNTLQVIRKQDFDVFIPTYYSTYFIDAIGNKPFVLTVYDMIHEVLPQYFTRDKSTVANKKLLMEKAARIIAISESTKNDIIRIYPHINASKIDVVYLSHNITTDKKVNLNLPKKYVLFVGNRNDYKNFIFFINVIASIVKSDADLYVVCAGGNAFTSKERELIRSLGILDKIIQRNFNDSELASYYSGARCFVFPSEYEGFGIPVLESMACGCPVILANHSSFPEVAENSGVYFELNNPSDLQEKIVGLIENELLRSDYIDKGLIQASKFSWQKTAEQCLDVFKSALNQPVSK